MLAVRPMRLAAVVCCTTLLVASTAYAQPDPGQIARECIHRMNAVADQCAREMLTTAHKAARLINALQDNGKPRLAAQVAQRTLRELRATAEQCAQRIHRIAGRCLHVLDALGAPPELMHAVRQAAGRATEKVQQAHGHAKHIVKRALHD